MDWRLGFSSTSQCITVGTDGIESNPTTGRSKGALHLVFRRRLVEIRRRFLPRYCPPEIRFECGNGTRRLLVGSIAMDEQFPDAAGNVIKEETPKGFNPGLVVLIVVGGLLLLFLIGNYALYTYAQKTVPPKKKKPVSKKKMKRERLKQGISAPGE
ncbi:unnamed protein product [Musa banksii]